MSFASHNYCPRCQTPLCTAHESHVTYKHCAQCGYRHYQEPKVSVIARIVHAKRILLIQRAVNPNRGAWGFPGGFLNVNEMPITALQREVREETSLDIAVQTLLGIFPMEGRGPGIPGIVLAYACICLSDPEDLRPADDAQQARWCTTHQMPTPIAFTSTRELIQQWQQQLTKT